MRVYLLQRNRIKLLVSSDLDLVVGWRLLNEPVSVSRDKWVRVTTAWRAIGFRMEERPPVLRLAANNNNNNYYYK